MLLAIAALALAALTGAVSAPTMLTSGPGAGPPPDGTSASDTGPDLGGAEEGSDKKEDDIFSRKSDEAVLREFGHIHGEFLEKIAAYDHLTSGKTEVEIDSAEEDLSLSALREEILHQWHLLTDYHHCLFNRLKRKGSDKITGIAEAYREDYDAVKRYLPEKVLKSQPSSKLLQEFRTNHEELEAMLEDIKENDQQFEKVDGLLRLKPDRLEGVQTKFDLWARDANMLHSRLCEVADSITDPEESERMRSKIDAIATERDDMFERLQSTIDGIKDGIPIDEFTSEEKVLSLWSHPQRYARMLVFREIVESPASNGLVDWNDKKDGIVISRAPDEQFKELFESFGSSFSKMAPFVYQLKNWGFIGEKMKPDQPGNYSHPSFTRDRPFDIRRMRTQALRIPADVLRRSEGCEADVGGVRCGKQCVYDPVDNRRTPPRPAVEYRHCPTHIHLDEKFFAGVPPAEMEQVEAEIKKKMEESKAKLEEKARMLEERKKKLSHRTCSEIIEQETEFIAAWKEKADSIAKGGYGNDALNDVTVEHSGYRHNQLMTKDQWNRKGMSPRIRGQTFFHRMMVVNGVCCGVCYEPVAGRDEEGNVKVDWSDPKAFYKWHLHHRTMRTSTRGYIKPSDLPAHPDLDFEERMEQYSDLQALCNHDHEQGESRKHWVVDMTYQNKIWYDVPDNHVPIATVLEGKKWAAFRKAVKDYQLDSTSVIPCVTKRELDVIIYEATGYLPSDLATWANKPLPWERRGYRTLGPVMIKRLGLNLIKKECGVCLGREGVECTNRDIRNETPQRMNGFHGDHGENADIKKWNPSELVLKTWEEFEAELIKLEGFRCGCCHRDL